MGLISGSASSMRFNIISLPETLDFELAPFRAIQSGSVVREREGFVPYGPGEPYEIGTKKWAFRVRIDKVQLDSTQINERLKELIKVEIENVGPPSMKTIKKLKALAEDELMQHPMPRTKMIECLLEGNILYLGSTSKSHVGVVLELLKRIGVEVAFKTPWLDAGLEEEPHEHLEIKEPGQSYLGCRFLKSLLNDSEVLVEPEKGNVKLLTHDGAKISLSGPVLNELDRLLESGAVLLSAKLLIGDSSFSFDAFSYRVNGLAVDNLKAMHWIEQLETRMDKVKALWQWLDEKFETFMNEDDATA